MRPPAAPKAGGCGSPPLRRPRPGPSERRAPLAARGAPRGWGRGRLVPGAAGAPGCGCAQLSAVCVVRGPGLGRGRGGSRCSSGSSGAAQRGLRQPLPAAGRLVRAAGRRTVDGEGGRIAAWDPSPSQAGDRARPRLLCGRAVFIRLT